MGVKVAIEGDRYDWLFREREIRSGVSVGF
jgi:hypothetical protein